MQPFDSLTLEISLFWFFDGYDRENTLPPPIELSQAAEWYEMGREKAAADLND